MTQATAVESVGLVFVVMLFMFVLATAQASGLRADQAPRWMRTLVRPPSAGEGPRSLHVVGLVFAVAVATVTQIAVVAIVASPGYGPLRLLLLAEFVAAAAWLLYLRRLRRAR
jgi:hypothetical protein